ncbi:MAG: hypothetical protein ACREIA_26130 [Opitutaceae bacterium]
MKNLPFIPRAAVLALIALAALLSMAALKKGGTVYSKRNTTSLLAEPRPLATAAATVGFAAELQIEEMRGNWLRVKAGKDAGWVFIGNISEEKPKHAPPAGLTTVAASETTTAAAARPLAPAAEDFAERHNAGEAREDVQWLDSAAASVTEDDVAAYLRENKKGEYAP